MAAHLPDGPVPGLWPVLHDDHHLSDHRRLQDGTVPVPDLPGAILCALYSAAAKAAGRHRHLFLPTRCRYPDRAGVPVPDRPHEAHGLKKMLEEKK